MAQVRVCPEGHRWGDSSFPPPSNGMPLDRCPICGAAPDSHSMQETAPINGAASHLEVPHLRGYEILGEIGRGGLAVVYKARDLAQGRLVAIKMLSAGAASSDSDRARFLAEAQAMSRLRHPNIVQIHAVSEYQGMPWFALEFMDRGSLAHSLGSSALPPRYAAELVVRLCAAIQAAHDAGILHRDVKPANVLLATPAEDDASPVAQLLGVPKLTDFGIAKRLGEDNRLTRTGAVMGTPAYMAPEQAEGKTRQATRAVDIYSLGAVLYECLTGRPPYQADTVLETLDQVRQGDPPPPDRLIPGLPAALATICLKAMARTPHARYASAQSMADDLSRWLADEPVQARREPMWHRAMGWIRRRPAIAGLSAGLALVTLALCLALFTLWGKAKSEGDPGAARTKYFGAVVRRWGVPEGVCPLTSKQVARREISFRFRFRGGNVELVEAVDRHGRPTTAHSFTAYLERGDSDRPWRRSCRWEYQRDKEGKITRETAQDRTGQVVWSFRYTTPTTGYYADKRGFPRPRAGSGAAYVSFVYSEDGLVKELRYLAPDGKARSDRNGIFGQRHEHDARGFVSGVTFLGHGDQPILHPDGYAREARSYDERGDRVETAYLGLDALPVLGPSGLAKKTVAYDADGNSTEIRAYGLDGTLVRRREGYAIERRAHDEAGLLTRVAYFDTEGNPARDRMRVARIEYQYADEGRRREESFFDVNGKPTRQRFLACTRLTRIYDEEGRNIEIIAHDLDVAALRDPRFGPVAPRIRRKHDERGNIIEESYFTMDGKPTSSWFGVHKVLTKHDERGQRLEIRFEDEKGKPTAPFSRMKREPFAGVGPAMLQWEWDEPGNNLEVRALGLDGKPTQNWKLAVQLVTGPREGETPLPIGVARVICKYDGFGNRVAISSLDVSGKVMPPVRSWQGLSRGRLELSYDKQGNITEANLFDKDGRLADGIGPSRMTAEHDDDGRLLGLALFGPAGRVAGPGGVISRYGFTYDEKGNRTSESYYGTDNKPAPGPSGYARALYRYDQGSNLTESQFFGTRGETVTTRVVVGERGSPFIGPPLPDMPTVPLEKGDVIVRYGRQSISSTLQLHDLKRREDSGRAPRKTVILRGDKEMTVMLPAGFPGGDRFAEMNRRGGRGPGRNPFALLRSLPGQGLTPPLYLGEVELRTEVAP